MSEDVGVNLAVTLFLLFWVAVLVLGYPLWEHLAKKGLFPIWDWIEERLGDG